MNPQANSYREDVRVFPTGVGMNRTWFPKIIRQDKIVFPTGVGMNRNRSVDQSPYRVPHRRGDEPENARAGEIN